jgi:hypothetical protein
MPNFQDDNSLPIKAIPNHIATMPERDKKLTIKSSIQSFADSCVLLNKLRGFFNGLSGVSSRFMIVWLYELPQPDQVRLCCGRPYQYWRLGSGH